MLLLSVFLTGCGSSMPWRQTGPVTEVNMAFTLENNLLFLPTVQINGRAGRYFFGSAGAHSVLDPKFAQTSHERTYSLRLNDKESVGLSPVILPLAGLGDAMIGADAWSHHAVTIDYRSGLLSLQKEGIHSDYMTLFEFDGEPAIFVEVDGRMVSAVVDTAVPDTLVLPGGEGRHSAHVVIAGSDLGQVDVTHANIPRARVGNRLLSKFLVTIDYGRQQIGLWRDPRIP
jgi:hypothetical protein